MILSFIITASLVLLLGAALFAMFMIYRNERTYAFRRMLLDLVFSGKGDYTKKYPLYKRYDYNDILNSFKRLRLESFYTEEEIRILKGE